MWFVRFYSDKLKTVILLDLRFSMYYVNMLVKFILYINIHTGD